MKFLLAIILGVVTCSANEMVRVIDVDFKRLDESQNVKLAEIRSNLDLAKEEDREFLERVEQQFYAEVMMDVVDSSWRATRLKAGDDWRAVWDTRCAEALAELTDDSASRDSLKAAFAELRGLVDDRDARILERVVRARFGGEPVWIFLIHWEREDAVMKELAEGKEAQLEHFLIIGIRNSDRKLVARLQCG
jgi:hypothetical protein